MARVCVCVRWWIFIVSRCISSHTSASADTQTYFGSVHTADTHAYTSNDTHTHTHVAPPRVHRASLCLSPVKWKLQRELLQLLHITLWAISKLHRGERENTHRPHDTACRCLMSVKCKCLDLCVCFTVAAGLLHTNSGVEDEVNGATTTFYYCSAFEG